MQERSKELLAFIRNLVSSISKEKLGLFEGFLKEVDIDEADIEKTKIEDEEFKEALKSLYYDKKVKDALKETEPPAHIKEYIDKTIKEAKSKAKEFFEPHNPDKKALVIKDRFDNSFSIIVSRDFFQKDGRVLSTQENIYEFELSCYYRKEEKRLEITLYTQFKVREDEITSVSTEDFRIFDEFAKHLDFGDANKSVQFNAVISGGEVAYNNDCDAYWIKHITME